MLTQNINPHEYGSMQNLILFIRLYTLELYICQKTAFWTKKRIETTK